MSYCGRALDLTLHEYRLLEALLKHPGRVYSRDQLLELAWEAPDHRLERTVDSHIKSLRAKLREAAPDADPIRTHRGMGYSLDVEQVSLRAKIFLVFVAAVVAGFGLLAYWVTGDLRFRYSESFEEVMVDSSRLLARQLASTWGDATATDFTALRVATTQLAAGAFRGADLFGDQDQRGHPHLRDGCGGPADLRFARRFEARRRLFAVARRGADAEGPVRRAHLGRAAAGCERHAADGVRGLRGRAHRGGRRARRRGQHRQAQDQHPAVHRRGAPQAAARDAGGLARWPSCWRRCSMYGCRGRCGRWWTMRTISPRVERWIVPRPATRRSTGWGRPSNPCAWRWRARNTSSPTCSR